MSLFVSFRLIPTRLIEAGGEPLRERIVRRAMSEAEERGIDLEGRPSLHVERGASGAPHGQTLTVVFGPATYRADDAPEPTPISAAASRAQGPLRGGRT